MVVLVSKDEADEELISCSRQVTDAKGIGGRRSFVLEKKACGRKGGDGEDDEEVTGTQNRTHESRGLLFHTHREIRLLFK